MSLSPLYPGVTSDLHVSTIGDLPPDFRLASITPGKDRHLSGLSRPALDSGHPKTAWPVLRRIGVDHPMRITLVLAVAFTTPRTVKGLRLAGLLNSLVRVSRRDVHLCFYQTFPGTQK